jgi:acetyl-CoA synthetase
MTFIVAGFPAVQQEPLVQGTRSTPGARWPPIAKPPATWRTAPNLVDYDRARREFSWQTARAALDGLPGGRGLNIAHEAIDRHAASPLAGRTALRWLARDGTRRDFTYADLRDHTNRFAHVLQRLGVGAGDRVAVLAGRIPELYIAALGALKNGSVFMPLFSAFGPEPIQSRIDIARAKVLVTTETLYRRKVEALRPSMPSLEHVILTGDAAAIARLTAVRPFDRLMADAAADFVIPPTDPEDAALLHFTSGTTGKPKGALHVHEAVVAHHATARSGARPTRAGSPALRTGSSRR